MAGKVMESPDRGASGPEGARAGGPGSSRWEPLGAPWVQQAATPFRGDPGRRGTCSLLSYEGRTFMSTSIQVSGSRRYRTLSR
jgi:hypothetical protein